MKKNKILHISHDDKFLDYFINDFKSKYSEDTYFIYREKGIHNISRIKSKNIISEERNTKQFNKFFENINEYDSIFLHYITPEIASKINDNLKNKNTKLFLIFWGGEIFDLPGIIEQFLGKESIIIYKNLNSKNKFKLSFKPKNIVREYKNYYAYKFAIKKLKKTYKRANYFCHYIRKDFEIIRTKIPTKAKFIDFHYGGVESIIGKNIDIISNTHSMDIMIGNSGSITNNHIEIFNILKNLRIENRKLITPLSYSVYPSKEYLDLILEKGEKLFDKNFIPILNFLEKDEYNKIYKSVEYVFMNHYRSQAMGNIITVLYAGKKLFMSKKSTIYQQLKNYGCVIFAIEDIIQNKIDVFKKLSSEEKMINKSIILKYFGNKKIKEKYKKLRNNLPSI